MDGVNGFAGRTSNAQQTADSLVFLGSQDSERQYPRSAHLSSQLDRCDYTSTLIILNDEEVPEVNGNGYRRALSCRPDGEIAELLQHWLLCFTAVASASFLWVDALPVSPSDRTYPITIPPCTVLRKKGRLHSEIL